MSHNLRDRILNADDIQSERIVVPEWDDAKIEVRGMTGRQRVDYYERISEGGQPVPEMIVMVCYDPDSGDLLFENADRDMLYGKSGRALERVFKVAARLSGIGDDAEDDAVGKSEATPNTGGS